MRGIDALAADLHARGLRVTPQRELIYSQLAEMPSHPTVEALHEAVVAVLPTVSLQTVYQALHDVDVDLSGLVVPIEQQHGFAVEGAEVIFSGFCATCARDVQSDISKGQ